MPITQRQGPIYFQVRYSEQGRENYDQIFKKDKTMSDTVEVLSANPTAVAVSANAVAPIEAQPAPAVAGTAVAAPVKRGRGRPKGSKNKPKAPKVEVAPVDTAVAVDATSVTGTTDPF